MSKGIHVIHAVRSLDPAAGGTSRVVVGLCRALAVLGSKVSLLSSDSLPGSGHGLHCIPTENIVKALRNLFAGEAGKEVLLVHAHGIWLPWNHHTALQAQVSRVPYVVSPHGMLEPWCLRHHWLKKRLAWHLYQHRDLARARVLHATAATEAAQFRRLGLKTPIAVIPNAVDLPQAMPPRDINPAGRRRALFLSRIHPKKGLPDLVTAWKNVLPQNWEMVIAGPDEGGHERDVRQAVAAAGLDDRFSFLGDLSDDAKWAVYRSAELFILPTYSENFGVVVAEALAAGVPVITTTGTPWQALMRHRCGWWIAPGGESLARTLAQACSLSPGILAEMGCAGMRYVCHAFRWEAIAARMRDVYRWSLGEGPQPSCVFTHGVPPNTIKDLL